MEEIKPIRNSVHVCSLQTSAIKRIAEQAIERAEEGDKECALRLRWLTVAMECNRQHQMQFLLSNLGSKEKSPKFRQIRMNPFWHQWKRESLRADWTTVRNEVDRHMMDIDFNQGKRFFESQRIELAARAFVNSDLMKALPIGDIVTPRPVEAIYKFTTPGSNMPGYYNQGYDYIESAALSTMSEVSESETVSEELDPWERPLEEQFNEKVAEFNNVQEIEVEETPKVEENVKARNIKEEEEQIVKNDAVESVAKPENIQKGEASSKKKMIIISAAVLLLSVIIAIIVMYVIKIKTPPPPPPPQKGWFENMKQKLNKNV